MAKNDNLTDYLIDLADGIRAKKGTTEPINPQDFRKEIESISGGGNGGSVEGDWEYYKFDTSVMGGASEAEITVAFIGVRMNMKRLVGDWKTKAWRKTIRGSVYDCMILEGGGDSYTGAIPQVALDLSQRANMYKYDGSSEGYTFRELLYADNTHPLFELLQAIRTMHPIYMLFSQLEKITKEEWERDDYTGVILD